MPRSCSVCNHPRLWEITGDLLARRPYRSIQSRYGISKSALERHVSRHVTKALRKLTAVDMPIALAAEAKALPSGMTRYAPPEGLHHDCVMSLALAWQGLGTWVEHRAQRVIEMEPVRISLV